MQILIITNKSVKQKIIMKKIILALITIATSSIGFAQSKTEGFNKNDLFLSGSLAISSSSTGDQKETSFEFNPRVGYFISDNVAIGVQAGVGGSKGKLASTTVSDESSFTAGAFARYYTSPAKKFSGIFNLGFNYFSNDDKIAKIKTTGFDLAFSPGLNYFLSNHFAIEASYGKLGFATSKSDVSGSKPTNVIELDLNLTTVSFGLVYKL